MACRPPGRREERERERESRGEGLGCGRDDIVFFLIISLLIGLPC